MFLTADLRDSEDLRCRPLLLAGLTGGRIRAMDDRPAPDAAKLLSQWMEWETGETPPGRVMSNLKTGGLRDILEGLVAQGAPSESKN